MNKSHEGIFRRTIIFLTINQKPRQHIQKQRHYFVDQGPSSQNYGLCSSMYWCESWTIKKSEHQRMNAFELWCWRRLLDSKEIQRVHPKGNPEYSLEGLMLKLKLQYIDHLIWRTDSMEKTLVLGKIESKRRKGRKEDKMVGRHHWLNGHEFEQALGAADGLGRLVHGIAKCWTWLSNWTEQNWKETSFTSTPLTSSWSHSIYIYMMDPWTVSTSRMNMIYKHRCMASFSLWLFPLLNSWSTNCRNLCCSLKRKLSWRDHLATWCQVSSKTVSKRKS